MKYTKAYLIGLKTERLIHWFFDKDVSFLLPSNLKWQPVLLLAKNVDDIAANSIHFTFYD